MCKKCAEKYGDITWNDLVRKYFPDATDDEAGFILWNLTAFPMADIDHIEKQLKELLEEKEQTP